MHKIRAYGMTPMNRAPERPVWIVLVKQVVLAFPKKHAIWIIHPMGRRNKMVKRPMPVTGQAIAQVLKGRSRRR
jgi:hypothetical protein